ncbi:MAG: hypothetical protein AAF958_10795 [Planctomycetota bacterium]
MLCREDSTYIAGEELEITWRIGRIDSEIVQRVELSVLWRTDGKGDEDLHVHEFFARHRDRLRRDSARRDPLRFKRGGGTLAGLCEHQTFRCRLPVSPLSYHGRLIQILWCVRLRLFVDGGKQFKAEVPFHLVAKRSMTTEASSTAETSVAAVVRTAS